MDLPERFRLHVMQDHLFHASDHLLVAVSGGLDSVVLCELCHRAGFSFSLAHCNFQLRGEESERDESFVRRLAERYHVPLQVKKFDTETFAAAYKLSIQEAARELRYAWFDELMNPQTQAVTIKGQTLPAPDPGHPAVLLTAHHADDNAETLLMNFFRGTGLHGLTGIPERSGYLRRPLLPFSRAELAAFASENNLEFVEDSSNLSVQYTRNFFRLEVLPAIEQVYPQVKQNLQDNIGRFRETEKLWRLLLEGLLKKLGKRKGEEWHIPVKQLMGFRNRTLLYEVISPFGFTENQVDELVKLSESGSGKYILSPSKQFRVLRHRHWFIMGPVAAGETENILIEKDQSGVRYPGGILQLHTAPAGKALPASAGNTALLDAGEIRYPLLFRPWKAGDYFYPQGMNRKKKKLARFFIDLKLSRAEKEKAWVLESENRICWVLGYRIDERFKITPQTKEILTVIME